jgi:hypothetical protein
MPIGAPPLVRSSFATGDAGGVVGPVIGVGAAVVVGPDAVLCVVVDDELLLLPHAATTPPSTTTTATDAARVARRLPTDATRYSPQ